MSMVTHVGTVDVILAVGTIAMSQDFSIGSYTIQSANKLTCTKSVRWFAAAVDIDHLGPPLDNITAVHHGGLSCIIPRREDKGLTCPEQNDAAKQLGKRVERNAAPRRT